MEWEDWNKGDRAARLLRNRAGNILEALQKATQKATQIISPGC
jgi:hypothetical protein